MIINKLAAELKIKPSQVETTIKLIDEGNTIPFIARYRKEMTGELSDVVLRELHERLMYLRNLDARKEEVVRLIEEQGKMTDELLADIAKAETLQKVEDLYRPYKQKKSTRASKAKEKGLEPLAELIFAQELKEGNVEDFAKEYINPDLGVETAADALQGAQDIIAEIISDDPKHREVIRRKTIEDGSINSVAADENEESVYEMYYDHTEGLSKVPNHRILAMNRGEKEKILKIKITMSEEAIHYYLEKEIIKGLGIFTTVLEDTIKDSYKRLIAPAISREIRTSLTERAEKDAIKVFAQNTEKLLMTPPVKETIVMGVDPSFRTGCKITVVDGTGKLLEYATIYPNEPQNEVAKSEKIILALIKKYNVALVAIGNGTASRETESFIANTIKKVDNKVHYTIVSEAGASVYSASKLATEEYPDLDVTTRGSMSIARRVQDALAELVKIDPKHIGVGQYQHDLNQKNLDEALTNVVEDCVNRVGVDLNTASPSLLQYVSGINSGIAKNIVAFREENGKFKNRKQLLKVAKLGNKAYEQCAGFLRIDGGEYPLDNTAVHPESYKSTEVLLAKLGIEIKEVSKSGISDITDKVIDYAEIKPKNDFKASGQKVKSLKDMEALKQAMAKQEVKMTDDEKVNINLERISQELDLGLITLKDIVSELKKPGRDPRDEMPEVVFRNDVLSIEDLKPDMELMGTVRNVIDFGAFVDIGIKNDGLVHISQISDRYISHPSQVLSVGDQVKVKILDIDQAKGRVSLTMKNVKQ